MEEPAENVSAQEAAGETACRQAATVAADPEEDMDADTETAAAGGVSARDAAKGTAGYTAVVIAAPYEDVEGIDHIYPL